MLEGLERAAAEHDAERRRDTDIRSRGRRIHGYGHDGRGQRPGAGEHAELLSIAADEVTSYIFEPWERLLKELNGRLAAVAQWKFEEHGMGVRLNIPLSQAV